MEEILIPLIVFGFVALIVKMSLDYNKWKKMHENSGGAILEAKADKSMGVSELRNMIAESVQQANQPLLERISDLEHQLGREPVLIEKPESAKQLKEADSDEV